MTGQVAGNNGDGSIGRPVVVIAIVAAVLTLVVALGIVGLVLRRRSMTGQATGGQAGRDVPLSSSDGIGVRIFRARDAIAAVLAYQSRSRRR